jgi:DNA-binding CsgD family transcriptional regulator
LRQKRRFGLFIIDASPAARTHGERRDPDGSEKNRADGLWRLQRMAVSEDRRMSPPALALDTLHGDESLARFSQILLALYDGCLEQRLEEFQDWAFELIKPLIPFDSAYWGGGRWNEGALPENHYVHLHKQSAEQMTAMFNETRGASQALEMNARLCAHAGRSLIERMDILPPDSLFHTFFQHFGIRQMLCQYRYDHLPGIFQIVSLYRHDLKQPFTEQERQWHQALVPHLQETYRRNRLHHMGQSIEECRSGLPRAVSDSKGTLHLAERRFIALLQREWPSWNGPDLPEPLLELLAARGSEARYLGANIAASAHPFHDLLLLQVRPRHALDSLTRRELEIAGHYATGRSYKEIACEVGLAQATVRNYLANVYAKLAINDKAQLALLLNVNGGFEADESTGFGPTGTPSRPLSRKS